MSQMTSLKKVRDKRTVLETDRRLRKLLSSIGPRTDLTREDSEYIFSEPRRSTHGLASVILQTRYNKERYSQEQDYLEFPESPHGD